LRLTRRFVIRAGVLTAIAPILDRFGMPILSTAANAQGTAPNWKHGLSLFGELKYPPGFKHFEYVNPNAPKAGTVRLNAFGTFDNFNEVVAGVKGSIAAGAGMISDTLLVSALDEVSTE
jgi:microcin C transport system substrate-binding protein